MVVTLGDGDFRYEVEEGWEQLPEGVTLRETPGVAVNARDEVFLLTRNTDYPVMVFDRQGSFLRSFGRGVFDARTHGMFIGADEAVWCVDDGTHSITKWSQEGELLLTLGGNPSPTWSGEPFNRPTHAAVSPVNGDLFITDGYGNSNVHRYTAEGEHVLSWGGPGIDAGQFIRPHNVAVDEEERVYVADREAHRVQVFDAEGNFIEMWNNIHRPDGMVLGPDGNIYIGELNGMGGMEGCPGPGAPRQHPLARRRPAGPLRGRGRGRGARSVHRAPRRGRGLARRHLRGGGLVQHPRPHAGPAAGAEELHEAKEGVGGGSRARTCSKFTAVSLPLPSAS